VEIKVYKYLDHNEETQVCDNDPLRSAYFLSVICKRHEALLSHDRANNDISYALAPTGTSEFRCRMPDVTGYMSIVSIIKLVVEEIRFRIPWKITPFSTIN
jgi:hypothetical protein